VNGTENDGNPADWTDEEWAEVAAFADQLTAEHRAAELGATHGRRAAEAWLRIAKCSVCGTRLGHDCEPLNHGLRSPVALPAPDLSDPRLDYLGTAISTIRDAYCAAFTAAVESTIREHLSR